MHTRHSTYAFDISKFNRDDHGFARCPDRALCSHADLRPNSLTGYLVAIEEGEADAWLRCGGTFGGNLCVYFRPILSRARDRCSAQSVGKIHPRFMKGRAAVCGRGRCRHAYGEKTCGYYLQVIIRYYTEEKINEYGDGCLGAGSRASTCAEKGLAWV